MYTFNKLTITGVIGRTLSVDEAVQLARTESARARKQTERLRSQEREHIRQQREDDRELCAVRSEMVRVRSAMTDIAERAAAAPQWVAHRREQQRHRSGPGPCLLLELPHQLLNAVLCSPGSLSCVDLGRLQQVCKAFSQVVERAAAGLVQAWPRNERCPRDHNVPWLWILRELHELDRPLRIGCPGVFSCHPMRAGVHHVNFVVSCIDSESDSCILGVCTPAREEGRGYAEIFSFGRVYGNTVLGDQVDRSKWDYDDEGESPYYKRSYYQNYGRESFVEEGDVLGVRMDMDSGTLTVYKNGVRLHGQVNNLVRHSDQLCWYVRRSSGGELNWGEPTSLVAEAASGDHAEGAAIFAALRDFLEAAQGGNLARVEEALHTGVPINFERSLHEVYTCHPCGTAIMCAVDHGHDHVVRALLNAGASIESQRYGDYPRLICAAIHGHHSVVRTLLASVNPLSRLDHLLGQADDGGTGYTALQYAAECGHAKALEVQLEFYPNDDYPNIVKTIAWAAIISILKGHADCAAALVSERNCQARRAAVVSHAVRHGLERAMVVLIDRDNPLITASDLDRWHQFGYSQTPTAKYLDAYDVDYPMFDDSPGANQIKWMLRQFDRFLLPDDVRRQLVDECRTTWSDMPLSVAMPSYSE